MRAGMHRRQLCRKSEGIVCGTKQAAETESGFQKGRGTMKRTGQKNYMNSHAGKITSILAVFAGTACMAAGGSLLLCISQTGASISEALQSVDYADTAYMAELTAKAGAQAAAEAILSDKYLSDGEADFTQTVDLTASEAGISAEEKNEETTYTLKDLKTFAEDDEGSAALRLILAEADNIETDETFLNEEYDAFSLIASENAWTAWYVDEEGVLYAAEVKEEIITEEDGEEEYFADAWLFEIGSREEGDSFVGRLDEISIDLTQITFDEAESRYAALVAGISWDENVDAAYHDCSAEFWYLYSRGISCEIVFPQSGVSLAEYALENAATVSLYDLYTQLADVSEDVCDALASYYDPEETAGSPLGFYWYCDTQTGNTYTNYALWEGKAYEEVSSDANESLTTFFCLSVGTDGTSSISFADSMSAQAESAAADGMMVFNELMFAGTGSASSAYQLIIAMNPDRRESLYDYVGNSEGIYRSLAPKTVFAIILLAAGAVLAALFFVLSILQAGRFVLPSPEGDPGREGAAGSECTRSRNYSISAPRASRIPVELLLLPDLIGILIYVHFAGEISDLYGTFDSAGARLAFLICVEAGAALLLFLLLPLTAKGKARSMRKNSLIIRFKDRVIRGACAFYLHRRATGKLTICAAGFVILSLFLFWLRIRAGAWYYLLLLVMFWAAVFLLLLYKCVQKQKIKDGIEKIAQGNLEYQMDIDGLSGDEKLMAENLNRVRAGMKSAVEEQVKSERMKSDLITNVSHDIKTPLTSIINYVDILKHADIADAQIRGYIDILFEKTQRLKSLTEDLVEASKISSGSIELCMEKINLSELIRQTNGEFEEKFARRDLTLLCILPENDMYVQADGCRMWRVIENLYDNAAKYAMPGSRVYVDAAVADAKFPAEPGEDMDENAAEYSENMKKITLTIKNMSEYPLNFSADELMERFVRGDLSRSSQGSGLGLEIARNLTLLQGGTFDLVLDGDLFKVMLTFLTAA